MTPGNELIFLPLGGSGEIGMNVNLYGCNGKWVMVDLGMTFADPGTDMGSLRATYRAGVAVYQAS